MWRAMCFVYVIACFPSFIQAQAVPVRSGEHEGFTRLVVHMPQKSTWRLETKELQALLHFDSNAWEFDLSQIFSRIGRERVSAVTTQKNGIQIDLACDCKVFAYDSIGQMVVLDVRPRSFAPQTEKKPKEALLSLDQPSTNKPVISKNIGLYGENKKPSPNVETSSQLKVREAELRLARHLSLAASLGLLDVVRELPQTSEIESTPIEKKEKTYRLVQLDAGTSLPKNLGADSGQEELSLGGRICIANSELDISSWAHLADFLSGLADLRGKMAGEVEPLDPVATINLAKHYIHFGFGSEALELLGHIQGDADVDLLVTLAILIDESQIAPPKPLKDLATCEGAAGMWGLISAPEEVPIRGLHGKSIVASFTELPALLQNYLGPRLASSLMAQGLNDDAQLVLATVKRQKVGPTEGLDYSIAQGELQQGNAKEAVKKLSDAVRVDDPVAPEALIRLIYEEIEAGRPITEQTVNLLASYAHQYRKSEFSQQLNKTLVLAFARAGQLEDAWQLLQVVKEKTVSDGDLDGFTQLLSAHGNDFEVLRYAALLADRLDHLSSKTARGVGQRLYKMGFDALAESFWNASETQNPLRTRSLLREERAIVEDDLFAAKPRLDGMSGNEVSRLDILPQVTEQSGQTKIDEVVSDDLGAISLIEAQSQLAASQKARRRLDVLLAETAIGANALK